MSWFDLNPILIGAGVTIGARVAYLAVDYAVGFVNGATMTYVRTVAMRDAGCSQQQIAEHLPRMTEPHRYVTKCRAGCPACTLLGYAEPYSQSAVTTPPSDHQ